MKETAIQKAIQYYLALLENKGVIVYQKNNTGALVNQSGRFIRFGKTGSPDFIVYLKEGKCIHLEVKNEKGRQSDGQKEYQAMVTKLGHTYVVVRSLEEVEKLIK